MEELIGQSLPSSTPGRYLKNCEPIQQVSNEIHRPQSKEEDEEKKKRRRRETRRQCEDEIREKEDLADQSERRVGEEGDGQRADVRLPLRRQLEELDVAPLDAVDDHCRVAGIVSLDIGRSLRTVETR